MSIVHCAFRCLVMFLSINQAIANENQRLYD
jgi:hypothetical protein